LQRFHIDTFRTGIFRPGPFTLVIDASFLSLSAFAAADQLEIHTNRYEKSVEIFEKCAAVQRLFRLN
jgi:hypothetical protein